MSYIRLNNHDGSEWAEAYFTYMGHKHKIAIGGRYLPLSDEELIDIQKFLDDKCRQEGYYHREQKVIFDTSPFPE